MAPPRMNSSPNPNQPKNGKTHHGHQAEIERSVGGWGDGPALQQLRWRATRKPRPPPPRAAVRWRRGRTRGSSVLRAYPVSPRGEGDGEQSRVPAAGGACVLLVAVRQRRPDCAQSAGPRPYRQRQSRRAPVAVGRRYGAEPSRVAPARPRSWRCAVLCCVVVERGGGRQGDNGSYREWGGTREGWGGEANGKLARVR